MLSLRQGQCESSLGSCDECRVSSSLQLSDQANWFGLSPFIIITHYLAWSLILIYLPTEGRRLSRPRWLTSLTEMVYSSADVTHPTTNWARHGVSTMIGINGWRLSHPTSIALWVNCDADADYRSRVLRLNGSSSDWKKHQLSWSWWNGPMFSRVTSPTTLQAVWRELSVKWTQTARFPLPNLSCHQVCGLASPLADSSVNNSCILWVLSLPGEPLIGCHQVWCSDTSETKWLKVCGFSKVNVAKGAFYNVQLPIVCLLSIHCSVLLMCRPLLIADSLVNNVWN